MLTQVDEVTVMRHGARLRAESLVQQAGYTIEIANSDGPELWGLLLSGYEAAVRAAMGSIELRRQEKTFAQEESRLATLTQNEVVADAKVWRRKAAASARRATRLGKNMPERLLRLGSASSLPALLGQVVDMVDLLELHVADIPGPVRALIDEGRTLAHKLSAADSDQEVKRLAELPQAIRAYHADKGRLYLALKAINDAGHELHAGDSRMASRYNLTILYRRGQKKAKADATKAPSREPSPDTHCE